MDPDSTELSDIKRYDQLLSVFATPPTYWKVSKVGAFWLKVSIGCFACWVANFFLPPPGAFRPYIFGISPLAGLLSLAFAMGPAVNRDTTELSRLLTETQDSRLISRLIALASGRGSNRHLAAAVDLETITHAFRADAISALIRLLPQIRPEDAQMLAVFQRQWLYEQLQGTDAPLILAILQATSRCGSVQALPYVEPLAQGRDSARNNPAIRQLAQSCAQQLRDRLNRLNSPQILLRASMAPSTEILLRPGVAPVSEELLRPGVAPDAAELLRTGREPTDLLLPALQPSDPAPHLLLHPASEAADPNPQQLLHPASETHEAPLILQNSRRG